METKLHKKVLGLMAVKLPIMKFRIMENDGISLYFQIHSMTALLCFLKLGGGEVGGWGETKDQRLVSIRKEI